MENPLDTHILTKRIDLLEKRYKKNDWYPEDHIWCGCNNCGTCACVKCKEGDQKEKNILIHFKSVEDLRSRIVKLLQEQKDHEIYEFTFEDHQTMLAYVHFIKYVDQDPID